MSILSSDQLKDKFTDKKRPNGSDFGDLIDTCINTGYTGNITIGTSTFTITNGVIEDITPSEPAKETTSAPVPKSSNTSVKKAVQEISTVGPADAIVLKSGTVYDGTYVYEDKIFPDKNILKVYVNLATRNRFVAYKARDNKIYWELIKRGWFGTVESLDTQPGLKTDIKSMPFNDFINLTKLKGPWSAFFKESEVKPNIKTIWNIS
jgi:hypothetical protein